MLKFVFFYIDSNSSFGLKSHGFSQIFPSNGIFAQLNPGLFRIFHSCRGLRNEFEFLDRKVGPGSYPYL